MGQSKGLLISFSDLLSTKYVIRPELSIKGLMHVLNFLMPSPVGRDAGNTVVIRLALSLSSQAHGRMGGTDTHQRVTTQHGQGDAEVTKALREEAQAEGSGPPWGKQRGMCEPRGSA